MVGSKLLIIVVDYIRLAYRDCGQKNLLVIREVVFANLGLDGKLSDIQFTDKFVWMPISVTKEDRSKSVSFEILSDRVYNARIEEALRRGYEGFNNHERAQALIEGVSTQKEQIRQQGGELIPVILTVLEIRLSLTTYVISLPAP